MQACQADVEFHLTSHGVNSGINPEIIGLASATNSSSCGGPAGSCDQTRVSRMIHQAWCSWNGSLASISFFRGPRDCTEELVKATLSRLLVVPSDHSMAYVQGFGGGVLGSAFGVCPLVSHVFDSCLFLPAPYSTFVLRSWRRVGGSVGLRLESYCSGDAH